MTFVYIAIFLLLVAYSPNPNDLVDLFKSEGICIDDDITCINPDDFLNLEEFKSPSESSDHQTDHQYSYTPQQLTPPISPQPNNSVIIDSSVYQKVQLIPITVLQQQQQEYQHQLQMRRKVKTIVPKPSKPSSSSDSDSNMQTPSHQIIPMSPGTPVDKALIRQQRLIRNRESAILSRNKKKEYVTTLETHNIELRKENTQLKVENSQLKERLKRYSALTCDSASSLSRKLPSRNGTLMLAVLFMVGFNVVPFSKFLYKINTEPLAAPQINTRHLLFVHNYSSNSNESLSSTEETDTPVYLNQSMGYQNRKVNIDNIRRWIPEPDLFNVSYLKKDLFKEDPLQDKLTKMYEKSLERSQEHVKSKKRSSKKKHSIGAVQSTQPPVQLYDSNLNIIKLNEFFEEIGRKDDTFYVFSFRADHLLLPAIDSKYNFSQIKMNLIMPRNNGNLIVKVNDP